jgi:hypothetical protein
MIKDQVVAVLAAEGYSRDRIRAAIDSLVEAEWRDEDEDWYEGDLRTLRKRLGTPSADSTDETAADVRVEIPASGPDQRVDEDPRLNTDVWASDLTRILDRTTGGNVRLSPDQIRRTADHLLHVSSGLWDPETHSRRVEGGSYVPDFTVNRWADALEEALQAATDGHIEVPPVELQVAANLLLHAQEDDWAPQAALLRAEHQRETAETR